MVCEHALNKNYQNLSVSTYRFLLDLNLLPRKMSMFQQYFHNGRRKMQQRNLLLFLLFEQLARRCLNPQNEQHRPRFVQVYFLCYGMAKYPKSVTKVICKASLQIATINIVPL